MSDINRLVLALYILLYPVALAGLLHLGLKSHLFQRRHLLVGTAGIGFLLGAGSNLAFIYLLDSFRQYNLLTAGQTVLAGLLAAWGLFAIVYIWADFAERLWVTVFLAAMMTMQSGPQGLWILAALFWQKKWVSLGANSLPFFILGALTHSLLRVGVSPDYPGYYRFSLGRALLVVLLLPLMGLLSWCAGLLSGGVVHFPQE